MESALSSDEMYALLAGGAPPDSEGAAPSDGRTEQAASSSQLSTIEVLWLMGVMIQG